jgi:hypothetical protein
MAKGAGVAIASATGSATGTSSAVAIGGAIAAAARPKLSDRHLRALSRHVIVEQGKKPPPPPLLLAMAVRLERALLPKPKKRPGAHPKLEHVLLVYERMQAGGELLPVCKEIAPSFGIQTATLKRRCKKLIAEGGVQKAVGKSN